jgi:hypothetical protein
VTRGVEAKITEFLAMLESEGRNPDQRESHYVVRAIHALSNGYASLADADIDRAMKPPRNLKFIGRNSRVLAKIVQKPLSATELRRLWENNRKV